MEESKAEKIQNVNITPEMIEEIRKRFGKKKKLRVGFTRITNRKHCQLKNRLAKKARAITRGANIGR